MRESWRIRVLLGLRRCKVVLDIKKKSGRENKKLRFKSKGREVNDEHGDGAGWNGG